MKINRLITNICSDNLSNSKDFYVKLFDLNIEFESDWFISLKSVDNQFELGIIDRKNENVPKDFQNHPQGFYLTFVVENADNAFEIAKSEKYKIIETPKDTIYGQRRFLLEDPDGTLVDVSSLIPNFKF